MQATETLGDEEAKQAEATWLAARDAAVRHARALQALGVHKEIVNRLLEPFSWHTVIVSSTEWNNFFAQRCSPLAQPEMQVVAEKIRDAMKASKPLRVEHGEWHLPFISASDVALAEEVSRKTCLHPQTVLRRVSVARCARVSYLRHEETRSMEQDLELYAKLVDAEPPHASPLEHVATPVAPDDPVNYGGNFRGWRQLRHMVIEDRT